MSDLAAYPPAAQVFSQTVVSAPTVGSKDHLINNQHGVITQKTLTLDASNATAQVSIFSVTGVVEVFKIQGVITTALLNCTAASVHLNDGTASVDISGPAGTTLTNFPIGSYIGVTGDNTTAITGSSSAAGYMTQVSGKTTTQAMVLGKKNGANTNIRFKYTTTDTPTQGVILFEVWWRPISSDGAIAAV